jgi:hypothetical protein
MWVTSHGFGSGDRAQPLVQSARWRCSFGPNRRRRMDLDAPGCFTNRINMTQRAVNPLAYAFVGSSPTSPTSLRSLRELRRPLLNGFESHTHRRYPR